MMKHTLLSLIAVLFLAAIALILMTTAKVPTQPVISYPTPEPAAPAPQPASKDDLIVLESPLPGSTVTSPLTITGRARGNWYFEATFPVTLVDWDGRIIAEGYAEAQGDWMTTEYVPFKGTITYTKPDTSVSNRGWLILRKSNASGEPQFDNALEVEITY